MYMVILLGKGKLFSNLWWSLTFDVWILNVIRQRQWNTCWSILKLKVGTKRFHGKWQPCVYCYNNINSLHGRKKSTKYDGEVIEGVRHMENSGARRYSVKILQNIWKSSLFGTDTVIRQKDLIGSFAWPKT